ncbi:unnamed protein product [Ectocarpus sp. 4 AP-2014]
MIGLTKEEEDHADDDHGTTDDYGSSSMSSHDDHAATASRGYDHGRRWLAGDMGEFASDAYSGNTGSDGETMFIVAGWLMLALAMFNYFMSRWVKLRLLKKAGCEDTHEYHNQLAVMEKQTMEAKEHENRRRTALNRDGHLQRLKRQVDEAKEDSRAHHSHRPHWRRKERGGEDEKSFHASISRHLGQAMRNAQALSSSVGSVDIKDEIEKVIQRPTPPRGFLRLGSGNRSKILPEEELNRNSTNEGDLLVDELGATADGSVAELASKCGDTTPLPPSVPNDVGSSGSNTTATAAAATAGASVALLPRAKPPGERADLGLSRGTVAAAAETGGGAREYTTVLVAPDTGDSVRASEYGVNSESRDDSSGNNRRSPQEREGLDVEEEGEEGDDVNRPAEEWGRGGGWSGGGRGLVLGDDCQQLRYGMKIPSLRAQEDGGSREDFTRSPLEVLAKREPKLLLENKAVSHRAEYVCSDSDSGDINDNDTETSSRSFSHRKSASSSNVSSMGRRVSDTFREQVRRVTRHLVNTTKLAMDVTKVTDRIVRKPSIKAKLDLFNDLSDIYPFGSPALFHKTLDVLLLLSCTYLAVWVVNFLIVAIEKPHAVLRHAAMLLPAAGVFLFNALSVKTSSLLLAISAMDPEIIGKVIDEQIDEEKLVVQFRERLTNRLEELGLGQSGLASAFEEVDVAGHGELTIKELRDVLFALNFHAPKETYRKLFNIMDKNRKGVVSYHQLCELVYNLEAAAQEATALKMKGKLHAIKWMERHIL